MGKKEKKILGRDCRYGEDRVKASEGGGFKTLEMSLGVQLFRPDGTGGQGVNRWL